ncbi:DUF6471 domain-containing protein [Terasakiella sp. A23]|uniref:DUF6471 domain-containing protein n=1 Tax=Terasakiella sp. FCG-A23 TaxID=3080561 RepID=UPI002954E927|nr:DUF6471 domain-containing protein [Terasakiella sp. A23]MDV7341357.1 DUF6471 domain-containing protein [Terasakiella sp. A23]
MGQDWKKYAKSLLKSEIARKDLNFIEVSERLQELGIEESPQNISNKIARGSFSATFMLQVLHAIGSTDIHLDQVSNPQ